MPSAAPNRPSIRTLRHLVFAGALALSAVGAHAHETEKPHAKATRAPSLVVAPASAQTWVIVSAGVRHGQSTRWTAADGSRWSRERVSVRGYESDIEQRMRFAPDGSQRELVVRGSIPEGDAAESFRIDAGRYAFHSPVDDGAGRAGPGMVYVPFGGTIDSIFALVEALVKAPGHTLELAPSGRGALLPLTTAVVSSGGETRTLTAKLITGVDFRPLPIWLDGDRIFGIAGTLSYLPEGWKDAAPILGKAQDAAMSRRTPDIVARVAPRVGGPVAFTDVRLYDADAGTFREHMNVVVIDGRIAAAGPVAATPVPPAARIISGAGKTLLPGLWDSHKHYGDDDGTGALLLSQGITSMRDMGDHPAALMARKRRIDDGKLLGPRIVPMLMIDGPGPSSDEVAVIVKDRAEALAAVRRAKADGFAGVKIYGSLDPALIAPIARQAKALGLRVQGHLPRTVRPLDAVRAGYDELTHINFVMMQAMPDAVVNETNGLKQRHYGPARLAAGVDLASPPMKAYLDELVRRGTVVDPTLAVFERLWATDIGQLSAAYAPFAGTLPLQFERSRKAGGLAPLPDLSRTAMRRGFASLKALVAELHRRGIPILAGSDGYGFELVRELELYVDAGMTPAQALATATIAPARTFGLDRETGSLAVGKLAEVVLVDGDPGRAIGDLRKVELVMRDGRWMRADALRAVAGLSNRTRQGESSGAAADTPPSHPRPARPRAAATDRPHAQSRYFHVSAPSSRRILTPESAAGSKFRALMPM